MPDLIKQVEFNADGDLEITLLGVPFGGPAYLEGKDLQGEYFSKDTDIGDLPRVFSFFAHGRSKELFGDRDPFGNDPIGYADRIGMTDEGWIYKVVVGRRKAYKNFLYRLAKEGLIGGSTTPFANSFSKQADGHIDKWHVTELALTPQEANPLAGIKAVEILEKSIGDLEMAKNSASDPKAKDAEVQVEQEAQDAVETQDAETAEAANESQATVTEAVEKAFTGDVETEADAPAKDASLAEMLRRISEKQDQIIATQSAQEQRMNAFEKSVNDRMVDLSTAFPALAKQIAVAIKGSTAPGAQKSAPEKGAEVIVNRSTALPANAPGNY